MRTSNNPQEERMRLWQMYFSPIPDVIVRAKTKKRAIELGKALRSEYCYDHEEPAEPLAVEEITLEGEEEVVRYNDN